MEKTVAYSAATKGKLAVCKGKRASVEHEQTSGSPPRIHCITSDIITMLQADVCHAYHTLVNHGVKRENIIVMMYDDIANHHNVEHLPNLEQSDAVTPENFLAILSGNTSALEGGNGRVIHGTIEDRIFVYFSDHGGEGLIAFPNTRLTVKRLNVALKEMHRNHKFGQLVFYLEACESGSMFYNILRSNINVYAITAANETESSYATYCDNDLDLPCLGDEFSVNWMEDSDTEDINVERLDYQFQWVREITQKSHVKRYGNMSIAQEPVAWFQEFQAQQKKVSWPSRDVELMELQKKKLLSPQSTAIDLEISRIQKTSLESAHA
ncbi:peptidase C13 family protein [Teladorsagia circumcincta]|uniref:Peptidase C13 family protein n=1 Tax=Teladorsagia circumcincta TaxID=45464 RepID=A0A2G9V1E8_TELCI|nr:peptidase C13 family protein [Teladorsagia circumcincta]